MLSDWLVGGAMSVPGVTISVTQGATTEDVTLAAGSYYLWDPNSSRSLIDALAAAINQHSLISDCAGVLQQNRLCSLSASVSFSATFANTTARNMAGFTSDLTPAATSHTAGAVSGWLWVPGRRKVAKAALGTQGNPVYDTAVASSALGHFTATRHNETRVNDLLYRYILIDRLHTTSEAGGELFAFFENVLSKFENFKLYLSTENDESSSSDSSLSGPLGPYVYRRDSGPVGFDWEREIANVDRLGAFELPLVQTAEYT